MTIAMPTPDSTVDGAPENRSMWTVCFDCEGVLVPEAWLGLQKKTGLEELKKTTAHEPDYDKLMQYRIGVLREHKIKLQDMKDVVQSMEPIEGARETLEWLYPICPRPVILTDTFENYAQPMFDKLGGGITVFCQSLNIDSEGFIESHVMRLRDQKRKTIEAFHSLNFKCVAIGDSYNDISMLQAAEQGILFRPGPAVRSEYPDFPVCYNHADLRVLLDRVLVKGERLTGKDTIEGTL